MSLKTSSPTFQSCRVSDPRANHQQPLALKSIPDLSSFRKRLKNPSLREYRQKLPITHRNGHSRLLESFSGKTRFFSKLVFPKNELFTYISARSDGHLSVADRFSHRHTPVQWSQLPFTNHVCWKTGSKEHVMFNKFALVITGLMLTVSSVGCCCLGGYGWGSGYRMGCPPCNNTCPPATGYYPQTGAYAPMIDANQTAFAPTSITPTAYAPTTTAALPGTIPGPTIMYQSAVAPVNTLPTY
jgi:hypothetical protein